MAEITTNNDKFSIPIGPQHPALKEPESFNFTIEGETITGASVRLGYTHRGIEKAVENRNWTQSLYLIERICGICSHTHSMAYCLGVERLADVEAPPRAQAIRVVMAELERIHSHLLWLGVAAHEAGFDTLFMYSWRDRETVMDLLEQLSGNRVNYSANVLGGVKFDISQQQIQEILDGLEFLEERTHYYLKVAVTDELFMQRTRGIAIMTKERAEYLGVLGPTARASGVLRDVRVDAPYAAYKDFPVQMVMDTGGGLKARFEVRINELFETYRIIREVLANLPESDLKARMPRKIKSGDTISRVEAPRGECFYYIKSNGTDKPERIKARAPTLANIASVLQLTVGQQLADVPMVLVGVDPCFSCNDRSVRVSQSGEQESEIWTWEQLRQYGIDYYRKKMLG